MDDSDKIKTPPSLEEFQGLDNYEDIEKSQNLFNKLRSLHPRAEIKIATYMLDNSPNTSLFVTMSAEGLARNIRKKMHELRIETMKAKRGRVNFLSGAIKKLNLFYGINEEILDKAISAAAEK